MRFDLPLTQAVLGDALGLSTVHVSRLITELRGEGVVQWANGQVEILDWRRLAEIAEFDAAYLRLQSEPV
jgi:CRP-like cAMP-binding protein